MVVGFSHLDTVITTVPYRAGDIPLRSARKNTPVDTSDHPPDLLLIGEGKFECVQRRKSRGSQFLTPHTRHHPARAGIAPQTPSTASDHSPRAPGTSQTARFEPPSRRTAGYAQNPVPVGDSF